MRVQVLYIKNCPNAGPTADLVRRLAATHGLEAAVETLEVLTAEDALRLRFLGSPSVRVDGVDVDPAARSRTDFGMACRLYGASGTPPSAIIAAAIAEAL